MRILILGCGPSGLLACHAAASLPKAQVIILSDKRPSALHGCQYLHEPIPFLFGRPRLNTVTVSYGLLGTEQQYAEKVYGRERPPVTSPQLYTGDRPAWDLRQAYTELWAMYESLIIDGHLQATDIADLKRNFSADLIVSTIPAPVLCQEGSAHMFTSVQCWAIGDAPERGQRVPYSCSPNTVTCDGTPDHSYYRISNVFGHTTVEWPGHSVRPPIAGVVPFQKPLSTTCECWPDIVRLGRYGAWRKGVLSHHVYAEMHNLLQSRYGQR